MNEQPFEELMKLATFEDIRQASEGRFRSEVKEALEELGLVYDDTTTYEFVENEHRLTSSGTLSARIILFDVELNYALEATLTEDDDLTMIVRIDMGLWLSSDIKLFRDGFDGTWEMSY